MLLHMCVNPTQLWNGQEIACRECWQCRENRINDWVGRCIAESETAVSTHSVTLTYGGGDHARAAVLTYSDVQKYVKLLRRHGYPVRYFAVGEYGSAKGRSHWHLVLFWQTRRVPEHELGGRFSESHWKHGYSYWEKPSAGSFRYVCKYIQKDLADAEHQGLVAMSKQPPLGDAYFRRLARTYVKQGLAPQKPFYRFPEVVEPNGLATEFYMRGKTLDNFCRSFLDQWAAGPGGHPPVSDLIEDYLDREALRAQEVDSPPWRPRQSYPWVATPDGSDVFFSNPHNCWYCVVAGEKLFWSFDERGRRAWRNVIVTETEADRMREMLSIETRGRSAAAYIKARGR